MKEQREAKNKDVRGPNQRKEFWSRASPLASHNPFMDEKGILRVGSRLIHAQIKEPNISCVR